MRIYLKNNGYGLSAKFPMTSFEMEDVLDKLKQKESVVRFEISEHDNMELPTSICGKEFSADIYKLNLFAERLEKLEFMEMTAFKSLLISNPECNFEDMLLMTYGLDSVPVFPCENYEELGKFAVENDMLTELEGCPDEIIEFLDLETVGRRMASHEGGMFVDGYYCVTSGYEPPDIHFEFGEPERCFFRLLIVPTKQNDVPDYGSAQWLSLPFDEKNQDIDIEKKTCVKRESALPELSQNQLKIENIHKLNGLAKSLLELDHSDFVKLKAVMEAENINDISDTAAVLNSLSEYEFDRSVQDYNEFGQAYLAKNLPTNFDISVLENADLHDLGEEIISQKHGEITSYGAISGRGQELYSVLTVQSEQQFEEDFEEDFNMEMGGMSL